MRCPIFLAALLAFCLGSAAHIPQQVLPAPVRLPIRHADPWAVKALIEGRQLTQPEISTLLGAAPKLPAGGSSSLLRDGYLVVNPTDNSLWWFPNRPKS